MKKKYVKNLMNFKVSSIIKNYFKGFIRKLKYILKTVEITNEN